MTKDMTKGEPWKIIVMFSLPIFIGNVFQQFYSMMDTMIVGRYVGVDALSAVGSTGSINFLIIGFAMGITSGFAVITAQRFGANNEDEVRRSVAHCIILCVLFTILLTVGSVLLTKPLLQIMNTPENIFQDAYTYIVIIFGGMFATIYYNMISSIIRALGDARTPLYFLILSSVLNIIMDYVSIVYLNMGVAGAAIATVLAQFISAFLCTIYCSYHFPILHLRKQDFIFDPFFARIHLNVGLPMAFQFSITAIGTVILQGALNVFGSDYIAAFTAANKVEGLVVQAFAAFGVTMANYCGQNKGAHEYGRIKQGVRVSVILVLICSILSALINIFGGQLLMSFFMEGEAEQIAKILGYGQLYLNIVAAFYPALALLFIYRNSLQGMGESFIPLMGGVGELLARFVVAVTLPSLIGFAGICLASPMAWLAADIPLLWKYFRMAKYELRDDPINEGVETAL